MPTNDDRLELLLLGHPLVRFGGQELDEAPPLKSQALLFYLAVTGQPVSRKALSTLLWGEMPSETARANLRLALSRLRKVIGDHLCVDRHTVTFAGGPTTWVDANVFAHILAGRTGQTADALRMAVITEREWLHQLMLAGLQQLLTSDHAARRAHDAINVARRMLQVAPWHEEALYYRLARRYIEHDTNVAHRAYTQEVLGLNNFVNGDWTAARQEFGVGVSMAEQSARRRFSLEIQMLEAISYGIPGNYREVLARTESVLPRAVELGDLIVQAWSLLAQAEFWLHVDCDPTTRVLPLLVQAQALTPDAINKSERFRIHGDLAVVALRTGDSERAARELDQALAFIDKMALPANWAFEGYANLPEVALALTELPNLSPAEQRKNEQRAAHACAILSKFAHAHRFASPRALIYRGWFQWQRGRRSAAFKLWQQGADAADAFAMRYDHGRAHFEIGRHLAAGEQWQGIDAQRQLAQAATVLCGVGAGYILSRIESSALACLNTRISQC